MAIEALRLFRREAADRDAVGDPAEQRADICPTAVDLHGEVPLWLSPLALIRETKRLA